MTKSELISEDGLLPEDFDLEEFQKQVNYELIYRFHQPPFKEVPIELPEGQMIPPIVDYGELRPMFCPPPPAWVRWIHQGPFSDPVFFMATAALLLLGFQLGGGSLFVSSSSRNIVAILSGLLIVRAGYCTWRKWKSRKNHKRLVAKEEREQKEKDLDNQTNLMQAEALLKQESIRMRICPFLKPFSDNVFEIAREIGVAISTDSLLKGQFLTTSLLTNPPVLVAALALSLMKLGVNSYCSNYDKK